ncbi:[citrate (pro-3S)-lyase] ligase [Erysipelotrichaceae bacterium OttesenSCG-928-M19]|nr:[citrate (pro-3S)-lyase] ligase [Erysipelotrichaceae bacterium OttesenSCG-928-M19]
MIINYNYKLKLNRDKLIDFLTSQGLQYDDNIDTCLVIKENNDIIACACKKDNVFKMIAVSCHYQSLDYVAKLVSELIAIAHKQGIFHYFIFTKMIYEQHFTNLGFALLVSYKDIGLFEMGHPTFIEYYSNILIKPNGPRGAIVMNCNPFTLGHRYLIEEALKQVDQLIIFIVQEDQSFFSFRERFKLVEEGVKDLENVSVIASGPYIISQVTFPTYFLKSLDDLAEYYTSIDIKLFKEIMERMSITKRFVGSEPHDLLTNYYNEQLKKYLGDDLIVIGRKSLDETIISASLVRKYYDNNDFIKIKPLVNENTYNFLLRKKATTSE